MPFQKFRYSRFNNTEPTIFDGKETMGTWAQPSFVNQPDGFVNGVRFVVDNTNAGRPDLISQEVYNTPDLWWVIVSVAAPLNPLNWPPTGTVLNLPNVVDVLKEI